LEEYKDIQKRGANLNEDQLLAVSKYEEVLRSLELSRELEKQFVGLANDAMKQQKKQTKKEQIEREEATKEKFRESQKLLSVLDAFAKDEVRSDFLNEQNGCTFKMTQNQLDLLDDFSQLVQSLELGTKLDAYAAEAAEHLLFLIESKNKLIPSLESKQQVTYADLRKLFDQILSSTYWTKEEASSAVELVEEAVAPNCDDESLALAQATNNESIQNNNNNNDNNLESQVEQSNLIEPMGNLNVALEKTNEALLHPAAVFNQQNTSDDYVLVSPSNEFTDSNNSQQTQLQKSPNSQQLLDQQQHLQQQQQPQKNLLYYNSSRWCPTNRSTSQHKRIFKSL
jgi:predicted S18 family serine protease